MDNEQLEKRLQWLDDERRADKTLLSTLENRLLELEGKLDSMRTTAPSRPSLWLKILGGYLVLGAGLILLACVMLAFLGK